MTMARGAVRYRRREMACAVAAVCFALCWGGVHAFSLAPMTLRQSAPAMTQLGSMAPQRLHWPHLARQAITFSPSRDAVLGHRSHHLQMMSAVTQEQPVVDAGSERPPARTVVVGAGPAGMATAIMLARRGWKNIVLYDRLPRVPQSEDPRFWERNERAYNIGLDLRGQNALRRLGCWDRIARCTADVTGRIDWVPGDDEPRETNTTQTRGCPPVPPPRCAESGEAERRGREREWRGEDEAGRVR